jgi:hypothetical protein
MATLEQILAMVESGQEGNPVELADSIFSESVGPKPGIEGLSPGQVDALGEMDFTGKIKPSERFQNSLNVISAIYPVQTDEYYQETAEQMYPEHSYERERFWNDIQLGLSLISGRSEGGRFGPIANEALNNWLTAGQPIAQAQREREGKVAQTALEMKEQDAEAFKELMGQAFITDMSAQLSQGLEQFRVLTKEQAEGLGLDTTRGQIWRENTLNGDIKQLQGVVPKEDRFRILSTKQAMDNGLAVDKGQVYQINDKDGKITILQGASIGENFEVLSLEEAKELGFPTEDGQLWQRDKDTKKVTQLFGIEQRPENFTVLSSAAAETMGLDTSKEQIWQRNNTTGKITELQGYKTPGDNWSVLDEKTARDLGLPVDRGGVWMQNKKDGAIKPLLSPANISEREKKIGSLMDILKANAWGVTDNTTPSEEEYLQQATKMVDGIIDMVVQEDGRIYIVDKEQGTRELINQDRTGDYPLLGQIDDQNPYAEVMPPTDFTINDLTTGDYEEAIRQITNLSYAMVEANDLIAILEEVLGPKNFFKNALTGAMSILPSGADEWGKFIETSSGQQQVDLFGRVMVQALSLNPRYPVAEQELINRLNTDGIKLFLDPKVGWANFNETLRFIQNRLSFNRNLLKTESDQTWLRVNKMPSGTKNDPIIMSTEGVTKGSEWLDFLQSQGKSIVGTWVSIDGAPAEEIKSED